MMNSEVKLEPQSIVASAVAPSPTPPPMAPTISSSEPESDAALTIATASTTPTPSTPPPLPLESSLKPPSSPTTVITANETSIKLSPSPLPCSSPGSLKAEKIETTQTSSDSPSNPLDEDPTRETDERSAKIKKLKAKLINEEHRLVLMKKIRQSQTRPVNQQQQQIQQQASTSHHHGPSSSSMNNLTNNVGSNQSPNPAKKLRPNSLSYNQTLLNTNNLSQLGSNLVQPGKNLLLSNSASSLVQQVNSAAAAALNQTPAHAHQRPKNNNLWNQPIQQSRQPTPAGIAPPHVGNLNRPPITTPPNVVQAVMGSLNASQQSILMNQILAAGAAAAATTTQSNKRSSLGNMARQQAITTPPNVVQDVRLSQSGQQQSLSSTPHLSNRRGHSSMSRQPLTTPPNILHDGRSNLSGQQSLLMNAGNLSASSPSSGGGRSQRSSGVGVGQQSILPQQQQSSPFNKSQAAQMLLQKRQAAKSAIQKQLEQTLMQLPEKRIHLGLDFIPNANNIEFVYYIGLEACVDYLTNSQNPLDAQLPEKPFECSTCGTDYTPSWSWKRSMPVCENCVGAHVKKSVKNSQTNRIKSVLSKAVKQEQEMDQRIMAEAASVVSSSPPSTASTPTSTNQRHPSLLQPATHQSPRTTPQAAPWPRVNPSPLAAVNRQSNANSTNTTSPVSNILSNNLLNNPLAALSNLQPATLASLLQMNPQIGSLASLMTANAAPTSAPNNNNQIAQVAALLMNQLTMSMWNKR